MLLPVLLMLDARVLPGSNGDTALGDGVVVVVGVVDRRCCCLVLRCVSSAFRFSRRAVDAPDFPVDYAASCSMSFIHRIQYP